MISPARIKKGIASKEKESTPLTIFWVMAPSEIPLYAAVAKAAKASEKAMGNLMMIRIAKSPTKRVIAIGSAVIVLPAPL
jgi:ABC-type sugar transport system substrate-binding protein